MCALVTGVQTCAPPISWTIQTLIDKEDEREREGSKARSLRDLIVDMENEVLANAGVDVFEEVFKLVFTKLYDEMFQIGRASCRDRVCRNVYISVVAGSLNRKERKQGDEQKFRAG